MTTFKIGDKVRIKKDWYNRYPGDVQLDEIKDKTLEIKSVNPEYEDSYFFTTFEKQSVNAYWLELVTEQNNKEPLKIGDYVKVKDVALGTKLYLGYVEFTEKKKSLVGKTFKINFQNNMDDLFGLEGVQGDLFLADWLEKVNSSNLKVEPVIENPKIIPEPKKPEFKAGDFIKVIDNQHTRYYNPKQIGNIYKIQTIKNDWITITKGFGINSSLVELHIPQKKQRTYLQFSINLIKK